MIADVFTVTHENKSYDAKVLMWEVGDQPSHIWKIDQTKPGSKLRWKETQNTDLRRHLNDCLENGLDKIPGFQKFDKNSQFVNHGYFRLLNLQNFDIDVNTFSFTPTHSNVKKIYLTRLRASKSDGDKNDDSGSYYDSSYVSLFDNQNFVKRVTYSEIDVSDMLVPLEVKQLKTKYGQRTVEDLNQVVMDTQAINSPFGKNMQTLLAPTPAFKYRSQKQNIKTLLSMTRQT